MNMLTIIILSWVFAFAEDIWFNRLLKYQLSGEAQRLNKSDLKAHRSFDQTKSPFAWVVLGVGLTAIIISFPDPFTVSLSGFAMATGVILCLGYIVQKLRIYKAASRELAA